MEPRNTYTPTGIPHARGNCDRPLKALGGRGGASGLKTGSNSPDAALTPKGQGGRNSRVFAVYVLSQRQKPLMPCSSQKARRLLDAGKARVVSRTPFVIQLTTASGETVQPVTLGLDPGYAHVGLSAISDGKELYAADVQLRTDIVKLNAERTSYRRTRRGRKTWYRKPRFLNRKKSDGWLAPSIRHKLDSTIRLVEGVKKYYRFPTSWLRWPFLTSRRSEIRRLPGNNTSRENRPDFRTSESMCFFATATPANTARVNPRTRSSMSTISSPGRPEGIGRKI